MITRLLIVTSMLMTSAFGEDRPMPVFERIVRFSQTVSGHSISVVLHQQPYDFTKHTIVGGNDDKALATIDGVEIAGTDGQSPKTLEGWPILPALTSIELEWDGNRVSVSKNVHLNLLSLTLRKNCIQFIPRPSGEELLIQATGGDGGGSYLTSIVLRKNGQHIQYPHFYWEELELPSHPYNITIFRELEGEEGVLAVNIPWLEPKPNSQKGESKDESEHDE